VWWERRLTGKSAGVSFFPVLPFWKKPQKQKAWKIIGIEYGLLGISEKHSLADVFKKAGCNPAWKVKNERKDRLYFRIFAVESRNQTPGKRPPPWSYAAPWRGLCAVPSDCQAPLPAGGRFRRKVLMLTPFVRFVPSVSYPASSTAGIIPTPAGGLRRDRLRSVALRCASLLTVRGWSHHGAWEVSLRRGDSLLTAWWVPTIGAGRVGLFPCR